MRTLRAVHLSALFLLLSTNSMIISSKKLSSNAALLNDVFSEDFEQSNELIASNNNENNSSHIDYMDNNADLTKIGENNNSSDNENIKNNATVQENLVIEANTSVVPQDQAPNVISPNADNEEELPDGVSESLADYLLEIITGKNNTKSIPKPQQLPTNTSQTTTPEAKANETAPSVLPTKESETNPSPSLEEQGSSKMDPSLPDASPAKPMQDDPSYPIADGKDYSDNGKTMFKDWTDNLGSDEWSSDENYASATTTTTTTSNTVNTATDPEPFFGTDCGAPVNVKDYCLVEDDISGYFHHDLTLQGLREPLFDMTLVKRLVACKRGEWCLEDDLELFHRMRSRFYHGPLCEQSMWECLFDIAVQREDCDDREFMFVMDATSLMCELFEFPPLPEEDSASVCFAHVLAALHVTYADFLASNMSSRAPHASHNPCRVKDYTYRMIKTYLCADNKCGSYFEARLSMEKFKRWEWFMDRVDKVVGDCLPSDTCGPLSEAPALPPSQTPLATAIPELSPETTNSWSPFTSKDSLFPDADNFLKSDEGLSAEDESLLTALSVASAVGLLFMVIGLLFWKKSRRRNHYYYRSDGYGKIAPDEDHLLPRSLD